jgi:hypothetical protein
MAERIDVPKADMAKAFNEWMRRYIEEPARFEAEFRSVISFEAAESEGKEPDYGSNCTAYLESILGDLGLAPEHIELAVEAPPAVPAAG